MVKIGYGKTVVTPPIGSGLVGYFEKRISKGVKDDLFVHCLCFDDGDNKPVFILSADFCWIEPSLLRNVIRLVEEKLGIQNPNIVIHATHTHTGPLTGVNENSIFVKDVPLNEEYISQLPLKFMEAIEHAYRIRDNILIGFGYAEVEGISFIRRYRMKDGTVITNPVRKDEIIEPCGNLDRTLNIMKLEDERGKIKCIAMNFAMHPDTIGGEFISGDWPAILVDRVSKYFNCGAMFFNGPSGDINHINPYDMDTRGPKITERIVSTLFEKVKNVVGSVICKPYEKIAFSQDIIKMPKRVITSEQIEQARKDIERYPSTNLRAIIARSILKQAEIKEDFIPNRVSLFSIDRIFEAFFMSGEPFSDIGIRIKQLMGFENKWVIENCDDYVGYIPDENAFMAAEKNRRIKGEEFPSVDVFESIGMEASYETSPIPCRVGVQAAQSLISGFQKLREIHINKFYA
ncbi:MAG: neutral/alkaline non-lysosomal ceramidase N-terminal domain-containing protein [Candidatus Omnitrophica bacterium]|nr:neutral/alkaline non-lysosomal ceramidase N-terminal domain-containing protein [Candidatus Omnitrophota bacterium]